MSRAFYTFEINKSRKLVSGTAVGGKLRSPLYLGFEEPSVENHSGNIVSWWESRRGRFNKYKLLRDALTLP